MTNAKLFVMAFLLTGLSAVIGVGTAGYIGWKEAKEKLDAPDGTISQAVSAVSDFEETLATIRGDVEGSEFGDRMDRLRRQYPFVTPANGLLTESQVQKFLAVKRRFRAIDSEMIADGNRDGKEPGLGTLVKWNFFTRLRRLRLEQAEELERQGMSLDEFRWVYVEIFKALVADGRKKDRKRDIGAELNEHSNRSREEIDRRLGDGNLSAEERRQLEAAREEISRRTAQLVPAVEAITEKLDAVPQENIDLVRRFQPELSELFVAGADLDSIEFFTALERHGVPVQ